MTYRPEKPSLVRINREWAKGHGSNRPIRHYQVVMYEYNAIINYWSCVKATKYLPDLSWAVDRFRQTDD